MMASVEMPDGTYRVIEMGAPTCGEDFCDGCGDCLVCYPHGFAEWCSAGESWWVIYKNTPKWADAQALLAADATDADMHSTRDGAA